MSKRSLVHTAIVVALAVVILVLLRLHAASAQGGSDPHRLYEAKCASCHDQHARTLVKRAMTLKDGRAVAATSGIDMEQFLPGHRGVAFTAEEARVLAGQFSAMLASGFVYSQKCVSCHNRAAPFARSSLMIENGALVTRIGKRDVATLLATHGGLDAAGVSHVVEMLRRAVETAPSEDGEE